MTGERRNWRILTWNLRGAARPDLGAIADIIRTYDADAVALQEVQRAQARRLASMLCWSHRWARKHYPYTPLVWWRAEGLAIITPHALRDARARTISPGTSTWTYRHRIVLAATIDRAGSEPLRLFDTHLAAHDRPDARIEQAARVAAIVAADDAPFTALAGDLNAPGEIEVIREFHAAGLRDPGGGPSHPSIAPRRRFDYVLVPDDAQVTEQREVDGGDSWWRLSDHLPVLVAFRSAPSSDAAPSR